MNRSLKTGLVQTSYTDSNRKNLEQQIRIMAAEGAELVVLQELHDNLYFCQTENTAHFDLAEPIPGASTDFYGALAAELKIVLVASLFEKRAPGLYHNTAVVFEKDGSIAGKYRKMHIPDDPAYYEKFYFTPGDLGFMPIQTSVGKLGVLVCWDQWYPEAARITSLLGAQIIFYPTSIGWANSQDSELNRQQYQAWQTIQRSHAIANGIFVVSVNRVGHEGEMNFWGGSFVSDPFGNVLYQASHDQEDIQVVSLNLEKIGETRVHWPFLRDRRIDSYGPILTRFLDEENGEG
jgi:N-carbamoylputrescine amidase